MGEDYLGANHEMQHRLEIIANDKRQVGLICKREIEALMEMAADVTQMSFVDKSTTFSRTCKTPAEMRWSLCINPSERNMKRVHWMFHELPWVTHKQITLKGKTHQDLVEDLVLEEMNVGLLKDQPKLNDQSNKHKKRNCIQQMYSKVINNKKQDVMRKGGGNIHKVQAFLKRPTPRDTTMINKKYSRSKTVFYWSKNDEDGNCQQFEVI